LAVVGNAGPVAAADAPVVDELELAELELVEDVEEHAVTVAMAATESPPRKARRVTCE
jgi:hypothetical protein